MFLFLIVTPFTSRLVVSCHETLYRSYQSEKTSEEQHGQILERMLEVCQDITPFSWHTVIKEGERQPKVEAEAVLVWMVAVVSSVLAVNT